MLSQHPHFDESNYTLLFTGRGRPSRDMALTFVEVDAQARDQWEYAAELVGRELVELTIHHDQSVVSRVEVQTFGHVLAMAIALDYARRQGLPGPVAAGGLSLGEMLASYTAGAIDFETVLQLAQRRGELEAEAARGLPPGGCGLVIGASEEAVRDLVAEVSDLAEIHLGCVLAAHIHLVAGFEPALSEAQWLAGQMGWRWIPQPAEAPWHTSAVADAETKFNAYLQTLPIADPKIPCLSATRAEPITDAAGLKTVLAESITAFMNAPALVERLRKFAPDGPMVRLTARGSLARPEMLEPFMVPLNLPQDVAAVLNVVRAPA